MLIRVLKSKLHQARVTAVKLHYSGSIEIDSELVQAAGIVPYEAVLVADLENGNRFETYVVPGKAGGRQITVLGAAARLVKTHDTLIVMAFALCTPDEAAKLKPQVIVLDEANNIVQPSR